MNILLPKKEELFPIKNSWQTFYNSPFHYDFEELAFKNKLKVLNDIVRQSILYQDNPNPQEELSKLIGDSYTSSIVLMEYLRELNIGENHRCVLSVGKQYDPNSYLSTHFITLVDNEGITYQVDSTPSIGYNHGIVEKIDKNKFYSSYIIVDENFKEKLEILRNMLFDIAKNDVNEIKIKQDIMILDDLIKYDELKGYVLRTINLLLPKTNSKLLNERLIELRKKATDNIGNLYIHDNLKYENYNVFKQVCSWKEELNNLINEDEDYKKQLDLSQCIIGELKKYNKEYDKKIYYNDEYIDFSHISPRFLLEEGLNVVLLKPSAFKLGVSSTIRERFLNRGNGAICEYYPNVGAPSEILGLKSMRLFHPCGLEYERSMNGPGDLFLIKQGSDKLRKIKKELRNSLSKNVENKKFIWYDGKEIVWNKDILNLVHTTDDPCEASLHYLAGYPEYQLMTRYMYPNPKIIDLEKRLAR